MRALDVLCLEPWYGGSHRDFLDNWSRRSRHRLRIHGLAPRQWRWRQAASAWELAKAVAGTPRPDRLVVSDYVDLARLRGLLPAAWARVPALAYFHENQLTYPAQAPATPAPSTQDDLSPAWSNLLTCVAADALVFNSAFHLDDFRVAAQQLLARLPRPNPSGELTAALDKAVVVAPAPELEAVPLGPGPPMAAPLRVAFPHRWEHDKDPLTFLRAVVRARGRGASIQVVLLGERYAKTPAGLDAALVALGKDVLHAGYAKDRDEYLRWLGSCDVVASTARQEFFGVAVMEGVAAGCHPLVPDRLAYGQLFGGTHAKKALWGDPTQLVDRLRTLSKDPVVTRAPLARAGWRRMALEHDAALAAGRLDALLDGLERPE